VAVAAALGWRLLLFLALSVACAAGRTGSAAKRSSRTGSRRCCASGGRRAPLLFWLYSASAPRTPARRRPQFLPVATGGACSSLRCCTVRRRPRLARPAGRVCSASREATSAAFYYSCTVRRRFAFVASCWPSRLPPQSWQQVSSVPGNASAHPAVRAWHKGPISRVWRSQSLSRWPWLLQDGGRGESCAQLLLGRRRRSSPPFWGVVVAPFSAATSQQLRVKTLSGATGRATTAS